MKLFIKNDVVVWALPNSFTGENPENYEVVTVPDEVALSKRNAEGFEEPLLASEVLASLQNLPYTTKRSAEYPPITDYLDGVVKGDQAQIDKYIADCQAVKAKYPKGS